MFHGSYLATDVTFLLKVIELEETGILEKEKLLQSGKQHYSEMLSPEYVPSEKYLNIFYKSFQLNKYLFAQDIVKLANFLATKEDLILVSLARAGTPIGVLLNRVLKEFFNQKPTHYSVSIIRDKGIDKNALKYIVDNHKNCENLVFIDGWTGKGSISKELKKSIKEFNLEHNTQLSPDLYVISDISGNAEYASSSQDYLIPSAILNSTVSGLVSRTVLNKKLIKNIDFHGCKFYKELKDNDLSLWFIDEVMKEIRLLDFTKLDKTIIFRDEKLKEVSIAFLEKISKKYSISNINYIKPGIGETTRVLLRRVPDKILIKDITSEEVSHILALCKEKNVKWEELKDIPYKAVGIISSVDG